MARVNITIPDGLIAQARAAELNISRVAARALTDELDRRAKMDALDEYLRELEDEYGPVPEDQRQAARVWADQVLPHPAPCASAA